MSTCEGLGLAPFLGVCSLWGRKKREELWWKTRGKSAFIAFVRVLVLCNGSHKHTLTHTIILDQTSRPPTIILDLLCHALQTIIICSFSNTNPSSLEVVQKLYTLSKLLQKPANPITLPRIHRFQRFQDISGPRVASEDRQRRAAQRDFRNWLPSVCHANLSSLRQAFAAVLPANIGNNAMVLFK